MLIKFCRPGQNYLVEVDSLSTEAISSGTRVRGFVGHEEVVDIIVSPGSDAAADYDRAYVMQSGVTVDTIK